jgi:choline dehydrogenase
MTRIQNYATSKPWRHQAGTSASGRSATVSLEVQDSADFALQVEENQLKLQRELKSHYDYIVCGSGSSGSVVAGRLAANPDISVLLLEAGGSDDIPSIMDPGIWFTNLGSEQDWRFVAEPSAHLNGRAMPLSMGKVLGGGSSINVMVWARGHQTDWDYFAAETGDDDWNYASTLKTYGRIESWHGEADAARRGTSGPMYVQPAPDPNPVAHAMLQAASNCGIPTFADHNGAMMEGPGGASLSNIIVRNGKRRSVFRSYVYPRMAQPNLTVLTHATVKRLTFDGQRATGVVVEYGGKTIEFVAKVETILSLGAVNTPKVLMQSGIGDAAHLKQHGIPLVQHSPGVGQNFQDHVMVSGLIWEYEVPTAPRNNVGESTFFCKTRPELDTPDIQTFLAEVPIATPEAQAQYNPPLGAWSLLPGLARPKSRGTITLTGPNASDPLRIDANALSHLDDLTALVRGVEIAREIGNDPALRPFAKREVMPGNLDAAGLENFVRNTASTVWHMSGTAKMGRDALSVVDAELRVYGIIALRIADASVMPRVTTGNTMAPCVVIGERLADLLIVKH